MKEINQRFLSVRGKLEIDSDYDFGKDLQVTVTVTDIQDTDQDDGSINRTYKCKLFSEEE